MLGLLEDYAVAIKGSMAVRARRIKQQKRIVLAAGAFLSALLLAITYLVNLEKDDTGSDLAAPGREHANEAPTSAVDETDERSSRTSTTEDGSSDVSADPSATDSEDDGPALPDGLAGDEQVASGPTPEGSSPSGLPSEGIQSESATSSVGGSAPPAPAPSTTATTTPPNTPAPPTTTGRSTTTTAPLASEPPPQDAEGGLLGNLTSGLLDTVAGLL